MQLKKLGKKAISGLVKGIAMGVIGVIVAIIVVFQLVGNTASELTGAANNISSSGLPMASLFGSSGVTLLIFMLALFIGVIVLAFKMFSHK